MVATLCDAVSFRVLRHMHARRQQIPREKIGIAMYEQAPRAPMHRFIKSMLQSSAKRQPIDEDPITLACQTSKEMPVVPCLE